MPNIEDAILLAVWIHRGQTDKAGAPYILHPLRVMLQFSTETEQIVAVLHDALEDSVLTIDDLRQMGYAETILDALTLLTRKSGVSYDDYIDTINPHPLAKAVKIADLTDNLNLDRIPRPTDKDHERHAKYLRALAVLNSP